MSSSIAGRGAEYGVQHLVCERKSSLHEFISMLCSPTRAIELIELGAIYVNDLRSIQGSLELSIGDRVRAHLTPRRFPVPHGLKELIVETHDDYIVVDKPPGLPVHALVDNLRENLLSALESELNRKLFITHRLDTETSGLLILALDAEAQARINSKFANGEIKRVYVAATESPLQTKDYTHYMQPSPKSPKVVSAVPHDNWLRCDLRIISCTQIHSQNETIRTDNMKWIVKSNLSDLYEVKVELLTGRTHQIRAQLAALGAPILGDGRYGSRHSVFDSNATSAIALRAFKIRFS